jgi:hypothetical protein
MRGRTNFVVEDSEASVRGMGLISAADLAPFLANGLLTKEDLEKGKRRYILTAAGRTLLGAELIDEEEIRSDARRAYLLFRGAGDVGATPAWELLSNSMQAAFASVYRTAVTDTERRYRHYQAAERRLSAN